jgi:hypothetical protein
MSLASALLRCPLTLAALALLGGCVAPRPTPYQPLQVDGGGYEETRLQENMYRVSFRGNRYTSEQDVIDFLYLRCAELTLAAGYSHFEVVENYGSLQFKAVPYYRDSLSGGFGIRRGSRSGFWMGPSASEPVYMAEPSYRLAMFVIRMKKGAEGEAPSLDARNLVENLASKKQPGASDE